MVWKLVVVFLFVCLLIGSVCFYYIFHLDKNMETKIYEESPQRYSVNVIDYINGSYEIKRSSNK